MNTQGMVDSIIGVTMWSIIGSLAVTVLITVLVIGVIVWAIRRAAPPQEDPAVAELKSKLARGEMDPIEYRVRMAELERKD
jgi:uncharacterized membrane protein